MKINEAILQASLNASECLELLQKIAEATAPQLSERNIDIKENTLTGAILIFGVENQIDQAVEEMAELTAALNHYRRGRIDKDAVASEIADVIIMMDQLSLIFGSDAVHKWQDSFTANCTCTIICARIGRNWPPKSGRGIRTTVNKKNSPDESGFFCFIKLFSTFAIGEATGRPKTSHFQAFLAYFDKSLIFQIKVA